MGPAYPKAARVRRDAEFARLRAGARRFHGREALVRFVPTDGIARLGIGVPVAYGGAPRRNRFRRLAREAFRSLRASLPGCDVLVTPRRGLSEPTLAGLRDDIRDALR